MGRRFGLMALMFDGNGWGRQKGLGWLLERVHDSQRRTKESMDSVNARVGFWETIGAFASAGATASGIKQAQAYFQQDERSHRVERAEWAKEEKLHRSENARRAALIGAEKRRARKAGALIALGEGR